MGPRDKTHAATRLDKKLVVHEMIHLLDKGKDKGRGPNPNDAEDYYNNPGEWNAFWQEGADALETTKDSLLRIAGHNPRGASRAIKIAFGGGSFSELYARIDKFWDKEFLKYMNRKTSKKFDKRLYQLYSELKKEGLWGYGS